MTASPIWHPFTQHGLEEPIPLVTHAEGAALFTADGRRVVDAISSWWVTTHGHAHPAIAAAIAAQAGGSTRSSLQDGRTNPPKRSPAACARSCPTP